MKTLPQTNASGYTQRAAWFPQRDGPKTGVIGVPLENSGAALDSKRCSGCGHWAAIQAQRCDRCGRVLRDRDAAARLRRDLEQSEALPAPSAPPPPRPAPEPEWKRELQARLAGYRDRVEPLPDPARPALDLPPPQRAAVPERRTLQPERRAAPLPSAAEAARAVRTPEAAPPIVDLRPAGGHSPLPARQQPQPAPLSIRAIAGAMDLGVAVLATGVFTAIVKQVDLVTLAPDEAIRVAMVASGLILTCYLFCFLLFAGRTAGMSWLGLTVLNIDGEPPSAAQRRNRAFGTLLSLAALGVGFIWAAADEQGLTWHDRMSRTYVSQDEE